MKSYSGAHSNNQNRIRFLAIVWLVFAAVILVRLFYIQVFLHSKYAKEASGARNLQEIIKARRGEIFARDARANNNTLYPLTLNRDQLTLISDNRKIGDPAKATDIISSVFILPDADKENLKQKLGQANRAYQPLLKDVKPTTTVELFDRLSEEKIKGFYLDREQARFYPERELLAQITGFLGRDAKGLAVGRYGLEAFFDARLRGQDGFVKTEKDATGGWIPVADRDFVGATDGDDLILTIDRAIQLNLCEALERGQREYHARSGTGLVMDPKTGRILGMCSVPSFDPNSYKDVKDPSLFNNAAIFYAYEPGSVFKVFTMSAALDAGAVTPNTTFVDSGNVKRDGFTIRNAGNKSWGKQTMTGVIKESINTGTVFAAEALGRDKFKSYITAYGFGTDTGIELKSEENGTIKSLNKKGGVFLATASFGQGITVTPIQLLQGYGTIANKGVFVHPAIVYAWKKSDGQTIVNEPKIGERVVSEKAAAQIAEMMRVAVDEGHGKLARVNGYTIVGKTGTAQIAGAGGSYIEGANNHTFAGFGPMNDPKFVMVIKYDSPQAKYAESTAVPTFGVVAKFLLEYLGVPPDRPLK